LYINRTSFEEFIVYVLTLNSIMKN